MRTEFAVQHCITKVVRVMRDRSDAENEARLDPFLEVVTRQVSEWAPQPGGSR